jgi:hypothetical protein
LGEGHIDLGILTIVITTSFFQECTHSWAILGDPWQVCPKAAKKRRLRNMFYSYQVSKITLSPE